MKILISVALILQLVIIITDIDGAAGRSLYSSGSGTQNQYQFGDIIEFPKSCVGVTVYKHYGIYVGPVSESNIDVGQGDNDIFHRTRNIGTNGLHCGFGKLQETRGKLPESKNNYLDDLDWKVNPTGTQNIIKRINELKIEANCGKYALTAKNCEHLATYVRYGVGVSYQDGTFAGPFQKELNKKTNALALGECICQSSASTSGRNIIMMSACLALLSSFLI